jgi:bifunctional DNase/RNase
MNLSKIELQIVALATSESSPENFSLILEDMQRKAHVPITIGAFEAQSIAIYLERMKYPRPLTYDFFKQSLVALGFTIKEVIIRDLIDDIYYASVVYVDEKKQEVIVDARVSDAIAAGIRFDCTISILEHVLEQVKIDEVESRESRLKGSLVHYSDEALQDLLDELLKKEDYESAARIRDMINKRKGKT